MKVTQNIRKFVPLNKFIQVSISDCHKVIQV
jgi:hypothetical protein